MSSLDLGVRSTQGRLGPQDDRPLSEQEFQLLQRLLSDPFSFPMPFKTWLIAYLEGSDLTLSISAIQGLAALLGITGAGHGALGIFPAGVILPYGGTTPPVGSLICDGALYLRTDQPRLFNAIGTAYGGDALHFNVPDLRGRVPVGVGPHADVNALNKGEGAVVSDRTPKHGSSVSDPGHGHGASVSDPGHRHFAPTVGTVGGDFGGTAALLYNRDLAYIDAATTGIGVSVNGNTTGIGVGPGGGRPVDQPAFVTINFVIIN